MFQSLWSKWGQMIFSSVENRVGGVQFTVKFHLVHRSGMSGVVVPPIHLIKHWVQRNFTFFVMIYV